MENSFAEHEFDIEPDEPVKREKTQETKSSKERTEDEPVDEPSMNLNED